MPDSASKTRLDRLLRSDWPLLLLVAAIYLRLGDDAQWWPGPPVVKTILLALGLAVVVGRCARLGYSLRALRVGAEITSHYRRSV